MDTGAPDEWYVYAVWLFVRRWETENRQKGKISAAEEFKTLVRKVNLEKWHAEDSAMEQRHGGPIFENHVRE